VKGGRHLQIEERRKGQVLVLYLSGRFDNTAAQEFVKLITLHIESGEYKLLINFADLTHLSSSGLRVLLGATQRMDIKGGKLILCSLPDIIRQTIEIVGFHRILTIYDNEDEALQYF
jgi:anti-anti-sigma factor